jgi:ABC-2 type transport system permease protein
MKYLGFQIEMYLRLLGIQLRSQMQFRFSFWMDLVSTGILNASYFISLALVLERFGNIAGWKLGEIAFLFGMIEMSFGTMDMIFSGFDPDVFSDFVRQGRLDQLMLRPVGLMWQILGSRFLIRRIGRILEGLVVWLIGLSLVNMHWTLAKILFLPVVFASQLLAMGALFMLGSTMTFWTLQSSEAVNILTYGGVELMSYPMQIYPLWMRRFFTFVVPFIFLNYYPALYLLDKPDPLRFPAFAPFLALPVGIALFFVAQAVWRAGINHYQGSGT